MENLFESILTLYNGIIIQIDLKNKNIKNMLKGKKVLAQNITFDVFSNLFTEEEKLNDSTKEKLNLFLNSLKPTKEPFYFVASYEQGTHTKKYEIRGVLQNNEFILSFSDIKNNYADSFDSVTKVYTRDITLARIEAEIQRKKRFSLIIIDVDNFKQFNDKYGHMFGDLILMEAVAAIKTKLGPDDIIGRIGGDEFLVVVQNNGTYEEVQHICREIKIAIQELSDTNIKHAPVSATLGCSNFPQDGQDYNTLFRKADKALLRGKRKGRNCFIIYSEEKCGKIDDFSISGDYKDIEIVDKTSSNAQVIAGIYEILARNNSIQKNIIDSLSLIGNFFLVERIHLYILSLGHEKDLNFEWVDSQHPKYKNLIHPSAHSRALFLEKLDKTGMIKLMQIKEVQKDDPLVAMLLEQKTASILGFKLMYLDTEIGFIRFEMCTMNKFWQDADVSALMIISKILSITINKVNEDLEFEKQLYYDTLTGIYNFKMFRDTVTNHRLKLITPNHYCLYVFNIPHFDHINTSYGTEFGDKVLLLIADALRLFGKNGYYCRVTDDRFLLYLEDCDTSTIEATFNHIASFVSDHLTTLEKVILIAGVYVAPPDETFASAIDKTYETIKHIGMVDESSYLVFNEEIDRQIKIDRALQNHMFAALNNDEFLLYLQPKVEIKTGRLYGAEALTRWNFKNEKILYPPAFLPLFERLGFINNLDYYIFEKVCQLLSELKAQGKELIISVNMSRVQSNYLKYVSTIESIRKKYNVEAKFIEIEITEGMYINNLQKVAELVSTLHSLSYRVSMDDFGSGYSNLVALAQLNFDMIKLDKSFCESMSGEREKNILTFIRELTNNLNVKVLCEGVESKHIADLLDSLGYHLAQGYYYDKALPIAEFKEKYLG